MINPFRLFNGYFFLKSDKIFISKDTVVFKMLFVCI